MRKLRGVMGGACLSNESPARKGTMRAGFNGYQTGSVSYMMGRQILLKLVANGAPERN